MGVRHLYTFLCKDVPNGVFGVDIRKEVENFKKENKTRRPSIIIDLRSLYQQVYTNDHELVLGGRFEIYNERSCNMFNSLKSMGVELIFFVDGPIQPEELTTVLQRRNESYTNGAQVIEAIDRGLDLSGDLRNFHLPNLSTYFHNFILIAQNYGNVYVSTLNECDQDIVHMANKKGALAVVSQDTDFLIFEGTWHYWSVRSMNFSTLTTLEFNRNALRKFLGLSPRQMTLFGTISGNDILQYEKVQGFHEHIKERNIDKFFSIANFVKDVYPVPSQLELDLEKLSKIIFGPNDTMAAMCELTKSLNFYCLENMRFKLRNPVLNKVAKDSANYFMYRILGNKECIVCFIYINLRMRNFMPYHKIFRPMFRRVMGVLLQHQRKNLNLSRKFYYKTCHSEPYRLVVETPVYPSIKVPPILQLLYHPYGDTGQLDLLRWDLLCFIISPKLKSDLLLKIPKEDLTVVLTLFYLMLKRQITLDEADCLLFACNCPKDIRDVLSMDSVKRISARDAELTFYFQKFNNFIQDCFYSVGLRPFTDLLKFDGLYFHLLRKQWSSGDQEIKKSVIKRFKNVRIYSSDFGLL